MAKPTRPNTRRKQPPQGQPTAEIDLILHLEAVRNYLMFSEDLFMLMEAAEHEEIVLSASTCHHLVDAAGTAYVELNQVMDRLKCEGGAQ